MNLEERIRILEEKLVRRWSFFEDEEDSAVAAEQKEIRTDGEELVCTVFNNFHLNDNHIQLKKYTFLFMAKYYSVNEKDSLMPWSSVKSRSAAFQYVRSFCNVREDGVNSQTQEQLNVIEEILIDAVKHVLDSVKSSGLTNEISSAGYKTTTRMKIAGKLIGKSYTSVLDKMDEFKKKYLTSLGYLGVLVEYTNIEKNWRFILPLLLTFLDDTDLFVKREACFILCTICDRISPNKLSEKNIVLKSQTMPLFKNAIQPLLLALPSLTPEEKSVLLLPTAYHTIFILYSISIQDKLEYYTAMSALLNDTLLPSIGKCKDYVKVLGELLDILKTLLEKCDEFAIVLTKQVVYTLLTLLMDPYIVYGGDVVTKTVFIIQFCIENVPKNRRVRYKYDVLGCMGTLKRRLATTNNPNAATIAQIDNLLKCINV